jgi:putative ABC transport system permease protein
MLLPEILVVALGSLRANKLRSFLTMLGIVIGIAAVIAMVALGNGAQRSVEERIANLGTTLLQVNATRVAQNGVKLDVFRRLTFEDAQMLADSATAIAAVQPQQDTHAQVTFEDHNTNTQVTGTTANYLTVRKYEMDVGRMFTAREDSARHRVAVVGPQVLQDLNIDNPMDILGQDIRINGIQFQVIGVLKSKGSSTPWGNPDDQVLVPSQTGRFRIFGTDNLNDIMATAVDEQSIPLAMAQIEHFLRRTHKLMPGQEDDFRIRNQSDFLTTMGETTQVFTMLLAGVAAVSLLVGGIGIMNIMLVSVTERTREIGIRKALGATRQVILTQFLIEAVVLCLAGGAIGVGLGVGSSLVLRDAFSWNTAVGPASVGIAFGFAALVGVLFGVWPARRAAVLDPIVALRYE